MALDLPITHKACKQNMTTKICENNSDVQLFYTSEQRLWLLKICRQLTRMKEMTAPQNDPACVIPPHHNSLCRPPPSWSRTATDTRTNANDESIIIAVTICQTSTQDSVKWPVFQLNLYFPPSSTGRQPLAISKMRFSLAECPSEHQCHSIEKVTNH